MLHVQPAMTPIFGLVLYFPVAFRRKPTEIIHLPTSQVGMAGGLLVKGKNALRVAFFFFVRYPRIFARMRVRQDCSVTEGTRRVEHLKSGDDQTKQKCGSVIPESGMLITKKFDHDYSERSERPHRLVIFSWCILVLRLNFPLNRKNRTFVFSFVVKCVLPFLFSHCLYYGSFT